MKTKKMSSVSTSRAKKIDPLTKKVPVNPKYKDVKPTVDTGFSQTKYLAKLEELKRDYKFRKDEIYKRMKVSTYVQLLIQVADFESFIHDTPTGNGDGTDRTFTGDSELEKLTSNQNDNTSETPVPSNSSVLDTSRSRLEQVIKGVGEIDVDAPPQPPKTVFVDDSTPYLLLDVRDMDAFNACHIISAKNYPTAMLARSVNYESKDMLTYKNQEGKIIIIYDEDEKIAPRAVTTLVQRGYDNIFMLSGGLKVAYKYFPEGLITGTPPVTVTEKKAPKQILPASQAHFTQDDLDNLSIYLDSPPTDSARGRYSRLQTGRSSKASTSSRMSSTSLMSSRSINSVRSESSIHPKPFK
ncbi:centrosomal protein of 41 kDa isoform X2 [Patella vulgata]|nr:centrosomal protein of 41 kDa isoform X2 [Patella vulgata]